MLEIMKADNHKEGHLSCNPELVCTFQEVAISKESTEPSRPVSNNL